jgi:dienelactone hydrolase
MYEKIVEIPTADGRMETFITHPEQGRPFAPVVVRMDVWGTSPGAFPFIAFSAERV